MPPSDAKPVVINLKDLAEGTVGLSVSDVIQREAFDAVFDKLRQPVAREADDPPTGPLELGILRHRGHNAIVINGRRGDGKTTFLLQLLSTLAGAAHSPGASLYSLGILDPTLIETKQNVVVMVLRRIQAAVLHGRSKGLGSGDDGFAAVQKSLSQLASGLPVLEGIGRANLHGDDWADPEYVIESGLEQAGAASLFEAHLTEFIRRAAQYLGRDAFVLAIDDVDTLFERGWPVMEAIRKYLTSPRLRIVMSGDMELYSMLVRRQQWQQMGEHLLRAEQNAGPRSQSAVVARLVDSLQDQYLIKVLKPENRIDLKSLNYLVETDGLRFRLNKVTGARGELAADDVAVRYASHLLAGRRLDDIRQIRRTLLQVPTRSGLQALSGALLMLQQGEEAVAPEPARMSALDALRHVAQTSLAKHGVALDEIRRASGGLMLGKLAEWLTRTNQWRSMARLQPHFADEDRNIVAVAVAAVVVEEFRKRPSTMIDYWLKIAVVREMVDLGRVVDGMATRSDGIVALTSHLLLDTQEQAFQTIARLNAFEAGVGRRVALGVRVSGYSVPPGRVREAQSAFQTLYGLSHSSSSKASGGLPELDRRRFAAALKMASERDPLLSALPPALRGFHFGISTATPVGQTVARTAGDSDLNNFANSIESLKDRLDLDAAMMLGIFSFRVVSGQASETAAVSLLRLVALIGMILEQFPAKRDADAEAAVLQRTLNSAATVRGYPTPNAADSGPGLPATDELPVNQAPTARSRVKVTGSTETKVNPELEELEELEELTDSVSESDGGGSNDGLTVALATWLRFHRTKFASHAVAPITLSRMFTRFHYASERVIGALRPLQSRYLGVLLHRSILAFLHAVGVEALRANDATVPKSAYNNPIQAGDVFATLLDGIYDADGKRAEWVNSAAKTGAKPDLRFFDLIFSCPIWAYFLARADGWVEDDRLREGSNERIFEHFRHRLAAMGVNERFAQVRFTTAGQPPRTAVFEGLYYPLNTIYLQGGPAVTKPNEALLPWSSDRPAAPPAEA